jgi:dTDP-4-dehydrorhamnose 3,5-epimerase
MLRSDSSIFTKFGEIYFSVVNPGVVKAWKRHRLMTQNYAVPVGNIKVVIFDTRGRSTTENEVQEIIIGEDNYCLLRIPPLVWSGFMGISPFPSLIANCTDLPHDPDEVERLRHDDPTFPYDWSVNG